MDSQTDGWIDKQTKKECCKINTVNIIGAIYISMLKWFYDFLKLDLCDKNNLQIN